jgi:hypothetical protein
MLFGFRLFKGSEVGVEILQLEKDGTVTIMLMGTGLFVLFEKNQPLPSCSQGFSVEQVFQCL